MIRKVVVTNNPILRQKAKHVRVFDKKIKELAKDLVDTLLSQKDPEGVGLAAPQIGKSLRIFAMRDGEKVRVVINPEIIRLENTKTKSSEKESVLEGCLSVPDYYGPLVRPQKATLKFQDLEGAEHTEVFKGFSAQIVQHEVDHLNGKLFIDEIIKQKAPLYKVDGDNFEEVNLI